MVTATTVGTATTDSGTFALHLPSNAVSLTVRRIGYRQVTVPLTDGTTDYTVPLTKDAAPSADAGRDRCCNDDIVGECGECRVRGDCAGRESSPGADARERHAGQDPRGDSSSRTTAGRLAADCKSRSAAARQSLGNASPLCTFVDGVIINNETTNSGLDAISNAG